MRPPSCPPTRPRSSAIDVTIVAAPEILTHRLRLRAHRAADLDACAAMWGDARVVHFIGAKPFTRSEVWSRILRYSGMWPLLGYGFWAIEDRENGTFIGEIGLMDAKREIDPPITEPEVGWALAARAHGCGYASEALSAVLGWSDVNLDTAKLMCMIEDGNAASVRVATKLGFHQYARTTYASAPVALYRRIRNFDAAFAKA